MPSVSSKAMCDIVTTRFVQLFDYIFCIVCRALIWKHILIPEKTLMLERRVSNNLGNTKLAFQSSEID